MNTLLEGPSRMPYYTDMRLVFEAIGGRQVEFDWVVTDLDYGRLDPPDDRPPPFFGDGPHWRTGRQLTEVVTSYELQFVWAVFSGFRPGTGPSPGTPLDPEPYADGQPVFWETRPHIQHPLAEIEIVCWDSTSTLLLCRGDSIGRDFRRFFPEAVDLDEYNQARRPNSSG